ncbi:alanine racemase [Jiella sp. MQZ9-1]|uniref:Alanine racemase n=1 Tax=Jiella flava TaxID=2816857 RepID=A0A939FW06_9HYPH|nr:alanine racemase [Jiella flava]MBO0661195.1 alanine racemase [Jiella flava]MCD2469840.1 alanine racemase [Jiella flava]
MTSPRLAETSEVVAQTRMPRVEIDLDALKANWRTLDALNGRGRTGAAVKADGYGLGAARVSAALYDAGCRDFFVAWVEEGVALRRALAAGDRNDARIYVLQGLEIGAVPACLATRLVPVLSSLADVAAWGEGVERAGRRAPAALQFETGMNRLGLDAAALPIVKAAEAGGTLDVALVMTHLASADEENGQSAEQRALFLRFAAEFPQAERSLANSAGCFLGPGYGCDLTRPGIALYGGWAGALSHGRLRPVATLTAAVLQVRTVKAGEAAGYGAAAELSRDTRIATVGLGYADGYLRAASGAGVPLREGRPGATAFIAGQHVPVLGRVSMDLTLLDVTDVPADLVEPGTRAEFFGPNVPIDDVADAAGTIAYELLTGLGPRVRRVGR